MLRLKNLLQYDTGKFIHVAILGFLSILARSSYIATILFLAELIFLIKKSKRIAIYSLVVILILFVRIEVISARDTDIQFPLSGKISEVYDDRFYLQTDHQWLCYYDGELPVEPGMIVQVSGSHYTPETINIMNTFDYEQYLKSQNIIGVIYVNELTVKDQSFSILLIRKTISDYYDHMFDPNLSTYLKLFVLGLDEGEDELKNISSELGISHLFAISGMHIGLLVAGFKALMRWLRVTKEKTDLLILVFLILYNVITGFQITILRASLLISGIYLREYLGILLSRADILSFIFIGFLIYNPYLLYSLGFQLSFLIAFSLILIGSIYRNHHPLNKLVLTTLLATIVSLPLTLRINHSIGLVFLYANLFFILYISYVFLPASFILGFIPVFEPIYGFIAKVFETALVFFEKINYLLVLDFPTALYKAIFWGLIILILINRKQPKKMAVYLSMMIMLFIAMTMMPFESTVFVRFLDVGQGDAIHVHDHGCDLLIDTGDVDNHDQLINYFKSYNIHKLDTVIISHFHSDHYGELLDLAVAFDIGEIYVNRINIEVNVPYTVIKEGQKFTCGDSYFQVLSANNDDENENNNSIVLYAHIGSDRYLFSGDMESSVENQILESYRLEVDIIKVPHHGSITSSTEAFLEQINAKTAIISVGKENEYGLPDEEVIERYLAHGVDVFATSKEGTITVYYYRTVSLRVIETYRKQNLRHYHFSVM